LPANQKYIFRNELNPKVDATIYHTKNALGFRGEMPPGDYDEYLTVLLQSKTPVWGLSLRTDAA